MIFEKRISWALLLLTLTGCTSNPKPPYNSKLVIQWDIHNLTGIQLDTSHFSVLLDSIHHTEGAIDSDYTWYVTTQFEKEYFEDLKREIRSSAHFGRTDLVSSNDTSIVKGAWSASEHGLRFWQKRIEYNPEPIELEVDTTKRELHLTLHHL